MAEYTDRNGFWCVAGESVLTHNQMIKSGVFNGRVRQCGLCGLVETVVQYPSAQQAPGEQENVCWLCHPCYDFVHAIYGAQELECSYYTLDLLKSSAQVTRFAQGRQAGQSVSRERRSFL